MLSLQAPSPLNQTPWNATSSPLGPPPRCSKPRNCKRLRASAAPRRRSLGVANASASEEFEADKSAAREDEAAKPLPLRLRAETIPEHVAIIMDGNARWARAKGLPASSGHWAGCGALKEVVKLSRRWGVKTLTVFAFSYENWRRPKQEVDFLMTLFENVIKAEAGDVLKLGVRVCIIGDISKLPPSLQKLAKEVEDMTSKNTGMRLLVAISYSGRRDITLACQKIAQKVKDGLLEPEDITESVIAQELETSCSFKSPYPDLLIRTSGELRLSNFLLWEVAYAELFFTPTLWPDFGEDEYVEALCSFQNRQRHFGLRS